MNRYIKFLVSIILIGMFSASHSQQLFNIEIVCDDIKTLTKVLLSNGERPVIVAKSAVDPNFIISVWTNRQGEMTVTQSTNQVMCVLAAGEGVKIRVPDLLSPTRNY